MFHHRKPHKITRYWLRYTGGAVGLAFASGWLIRHSRLGGSDDIDRWLREGREAVMTFIREHVEQPVWSCSLTAVLMERTRKNSRSRYEWHNHKRGLSSSFGGSELIQTVEGYPVALLYLWIFFTLILLYVLSTFMVHAACFFRTLPIGIFLKSPTQKVVCPLYDFPKLLYVCVLVSASVYQGWSLWNFP